jgi:hypothetical protein
MLEIEVDETTGRMQRDELLGLLNTTTSVENQRITARIPVVKLQELLDEEQSQPHAAPLPPTPVVVRFKPPAEPPRARWHMIAASFMATMMFGIAVMVTLF